MERVRQLAAQACRIDVIGRPDKSARHQALARKCAIVLRPLSHPIFVDGERFAREYRAIAGRVLGERRNRDLPNLGAEFRESLYRRLDTRCHLCVGLHIVRVEMADHADPESLHAMGKCGCIAARRAIRAAGIECIVTSDHVQHQRIVPHRPRQWPDVVQRVGQRNDAPPANYAVSGFHADHAAHRRRIANRAAGIRANRRGQETGSGRRARTA